MFWINPDKWTELDVWFNADGECKWSQEARHKGERKFHRSKNLEPEVTGKVGEERHKLNPIPAPAISRDVGRDLWDACVSSHYLIWPKLNEMTQAESHVNAHIKTHMCAYSHSHEHFFPLYRMRMRQWFGKYQVNFRNADSQTRVFRFRKSTTGWIIGLAI